MTSSGPGGKKVSEMKAEHQQFLDAQATTTRCAFCKSWKYEGSAADGRLEAERHRQEEHPERAPGGELAEAFERRKRRRKPWTLDEVTEAFARFEREHDRPAREADIPLCPYLPSMNSALKVAGSWRRAQALGHAALSASLPTGTAVAAPDPSGHGDAPERPAGRDPDPVPPDATVRLRAALHELADAAVDYLSESR